MPHPQPLGRTYELLGEAMTETTDILEALLDKAKEKPSQRAGQLIVNALGCCEHRDGDCIFYTSNEELLEQIQDD